MPSHLRIPVATISQIAPHPNADSLDVAMVLGWQVVVGRNQFADGDKVVLFPPDTVLPGELSDAWGVTQYLDKGRIKATKLRGQPSFGLVMPAHIPEWQVGDDVAADFPGVTKWEPPTREAKQRGQGKFIPNPDHLPRDSRFPEFTHVENLRNFPDLFDDDEIVIVTEKLHGTNSRVGIIDGQRMAGSHRIRRGEGDALYWSPWSQPGVEEMLTALAKHHKQVVLYGEILGTDVQSLDYGYTGHEGYAAFDLIIDGRYTDYDAFFGICTEYSVPIVPLLHQGHFDLSKVRELAKGPTTLNLNASHIREGVVVRPLIERCDPRIGRVVAKYVSDDYLCMRKSDYAEV